MNDPYPQNLVDDDEPVTPAQADDRLISAIHRLAQAVEQNTLALLDRPTSPRPALAALPPVQAAQNVSVCPIHNTPWKVVPAGISKKTGQPYEAFRACSVAGCDQRPPR